MPVISTEQPFHVVLVGSGGFHSGYELETQAAAGAAEANAAAEALGITARYEAVPKS